MDKGQLDDRSILTLLERLAAFQRAVRLGPADPRAEAGLTFFRAYYQKIPASVARRLTEIDPGSMDTILAATSADGTPAAREAVGRQIAGGAACAQVIRAINVYRRRLGLPEYQEGDHDGTE